MSCNKSKVTSNPPGIKKKEEPLWVEPYSIPPCQTKERTNTKKESQAQKGVGKKQKAWRCLCIHCCTHSCLTLGHSDTRSMDWQCHLLSYYGQLFLQYWQTLFGTCLCWVSLGAWLLGWRNYECIWLNNFRRCCAFGFDDKSHVREKCIM